MDTFYQRFFPGESSDAEAGYHRELQSHVKNARAILDFGCGDNTELARYRSPGRQVWGVDTHVHPHLHHPNWFRCLSPSGKAPFPDHSFDIIASCWVLEHVENPEAFLGEIQRLLKPGGSFISVSINSRHYVTLLSRLIGLLPHFITQKLVQKLYGRPTHDTFPTYFRLNSGASLRRSAQRIGLKLATNERFANPDYFFFSPLLRRAAIVVDYLLERFHPELGRLYFVSTLRKPIGDAEQAVAFAPALQPA